MRLEREPESADRRATVPTRPARTPARGPAGRDTRQDRSFYTLPRYRDRPRPPPFPISHRLRGAAHKLEEFTRLALHDLKRVCWKRPRVLLQSNQQPASGSGHRSKLLCAPQAIGHREEDAWWGLMGYTQSVDRREERLEEDRPKDAIRANNHVPRGGGDLMW